MTIVYNESGLTQPVGKIPRKKKSGGYKNVYNESGLTQPVGLGIYATFEKVEEAFTTNPV